METGYLQAYVGLDYSLCVW